MKKIFLTSLLLIQIYAYSQNRSLSDSFNLKITEVKGDLNKDNHCCPIKKEAKLMAS
jgi:hypothetical protein